MQGCSEAASVLKGVEGHLRQRINPGYTKVKFYGSPLEDDPFLFGMVNSQWLC